MGVKSGEVVDESMKAQPPMKKQRTQTLDSAERSQPPPSSQSSPAIVTTADTSGTSGRYNDGASAEQKHTAHRTRGSTRSQLTTTLDLHHRGSKCTDLVCLLHEHRTVVAASGDNGPLDVLLLQQNFLKDASFDTVLDPQKHPQWHALLCNLHTVVLSTNAIQEFPRGIENLAGTLRVLSLSNNSISSLPVSLSLLTNLEKLDLRNNVLKDIERKALQGLSRLQWLSLSNNQLTDVSQLPEIPSLTFLGLFGNKLGDREHTVHALRRCSPNIEELTIAGNDPMYLSPLLPGQACDFKKILVRVLPRLQWLDSQFITARERETLTKEEDQ